MKNVILLIICFAFFNSFGQNGTIVVKSKNIPDDTLVEIRIKDIGKEERKTILKGNIVNGELVFENPFKELDEASLRITAPNSKPIVVLFLAEPGDIIIQNDSEYSEEYASDFEVTGVLNDKLNKHKQVLESRVYQLLEIANELSELFKQRMTEGIVNEREQELEQKYEQLNSEVEKITQQFADDNKNNELGLFLYYSTLETDDHAKGKCKTQFDQYPKALKESLIGKKIAEHIKWHKLL